MPWTWAWLPLACAGPASEFLSEEFFPGYHVLEQVAGSKYRVYERSEWNASAPELDLSKIEGLYALLRIAPREPLQLPCAFFSPQGQMLELRDLFNWPVVFFIESGVWLWPAVRIGFQQKVQGLNVTLRTLSTRPRVFQVADFMTAEEAEQVKAIGARQGLVSSKGQMQSNDLKKGTSHAAFRTSRQAWLANDLAPIIQELDERTSRLTRIPASHNEPVQLLRYDTGTYYHAHMDWTELDFYPDQRAIWMDSHFGHFDRLATLFWYLNDVAQGGETIFPKQGQPICAPKSMGGPPARTCRGAPDPEMNSCAKGLKVRPERGSAVLWYNFLATGRGDRNALHAGCPVGENETKWSGNKWVRNKPWGTEGHWIQGHPALKRFGFLADDQNEVAKACHLALESFYDEPITLLWLHEGLRNELATVPPHGTLAQLSYDGHLFQVRAGKRVSNVVSCRAPSLDLQITRALELVSAQEEL